MSDSPLTTHPQPLGVYGDGDDPAGADAAVAMEQRFLRVASHELRGPLALIQGYLSMVLEGDFGPINGDVAHAITIAFERCQVMSGVVDRMLDTARTAASSSATPETDKLPLVDA